MSCFFPDGMVVDMETVALFYKRSPKEEGLMEKHCVSLEIAKALKEAGWNKETEFWWWLQDAEGENYPNVRYADCGEYPAPLATEILEELPHFISNRNTINDLTIWFDGEEDKWRVDYGSQGAELDKSLPNALAKMWLYLKKEKLTNPR